MEDLSYDEKIQLLRENDIPIMNEFVENKRADLAKRIYVEKIYTMLFDKSNNLGKLVFATHGGIDFIKSLSYEIKLDSKLSLDTVVSMLLNAREKGENIYINYNGVLLYSLDVSFDSAYLEVYDYSKEEIDYVRKLL